MAALSWAQGLPTGSVATEIDLGKYFQGHSGCFVVYDYGRNTYTLYNPGICSTRFTPCSTFKIANSLIALQTGVAPDTSFLIRYDSTKHPINSDILSAEPFIRWPYDQTMTTAFRFSVVWYYQEIAKSIGETRMQQYVDSLQYGNKNISSGIDHFWLSGSIKISADEEVELIKKLVDNRLHGFSLATQEKVKGIMLRESNDRYRLYGKTGGGEIAPDSTIGWFVGFVTTGSNRYVFALNIFVKSFADLSGHQVDLTKRILHGLGVL